MSSTYGLCPLCLNPGHLRESHIIPEYWYKLAYDEKHRMLKVGDLPTAKPDIFVQKGVRVELLCDACEGFIERIYERPFMKFWSGPNALPDVLQQDRVLVQVPDPKLLKLFILSVVWRAAAAGSRIQDWEPVVIPAHADRIRRMLLAQDAGAESEYPLEVVALVDHETVLRPLIGSPFTQTQGSIQSVDFVFGGCLWRTHCAPPGAAVRGEREIFLQHNGDLWVRRMTACDYEPLFRSVMADMARREP